MVAKNGLDGGGRVRYQSIHVRTSTLLGGFTMSKSTWVAAIALMVGLVGLMAAYPAISNNFIATAIAHAGADSVQVTIYE